MERSAKTEDLDGFAGASEPVVEPGPLLRWPRNCGPRESAEPCPFRHAEYELRLVKRPEQSMRASAIALCLPSPYAALNIRIGLLGARHDGYSRSDPIRE